MRFSTVLAPGQTQQEADVEWRVLLRGERDLRARRPMDFTTRGLYRELLGPQIDVAGETSELCS